MTARRLANWMRPSSSFRNSARPGMRAAWSFGGSVESTRPGTRWPRRSSTAPGGRLWTTQFVAHVRAFRDDAAAHSDRAFAFQRQGDIAKAIDEYEAAVAADPKWVRARVNLIALYGGKRQWDKAEQHFQALVDLGLRVTEGHYNFAVCLAAQGETAKAAEQFRKALRDQSPVRAGVGRPGTDRRKEWQPGRRRGLVSQGGRAGAGRCGDAVQSRAHDAGTPRQSTGDRRARADRGPRRSQSGPSPLRARHRARAGRRRRRRPPLCRGGARSRAGARTGGARRRDRTGPGQAAVSWRRHIPGDGRGGVARRIAGFGRCFSNRSARWPRKPGCAFVIRTAPPAVSTCRRSWVRGSRCSITTTTAISTSLSCRGGPLGDATRGRQTATACSGTT